MKAPSEVYQASAMRLDEAIKRDIYELGTETKKVAQNGSITYEGRKCFIGEAFQGQYVSLDREIKEGLTLVRFSNVKLGWLDASPNDRLQPTAPAYGLFRSLGEQSL